MTDIATIPNNKFVIAIKYSRIIKPTPTFELPNQFLVWVALKVLTRSDLDLLPTEYYKERLESQLKNKEIYMNKDNSTESTVLSLLTHLPVPIDWISFLKLSSTKPLFPLPTPLFFPLSFPSLSTKPIPSASCHNNTTCPPLQPYVTQPTLSISDLPSSSFTSTSIQGINPEVMAANTPNSESTSTGPQFQAPYFTPIPYPGTPGSLFLERANISEFLERFDNMCDDYRMSTSEKICRLL